MPCACQQSSCGGKREEEFIRQLLKVEQQNSEQLRKSSIAKGRAAEAERWMRCLFVILADINVNVCASVWVLTCCYNVLRTFI